LSGRIQFDAGGKTIELRTGDSVIIEGKVAHPGNGFGTL
jgi:quercetin dioxygenase-like cupin family protein